MSKEEKYESLLERLEFNRRMSLISPDFVSLGWALENFLGVKKKKIKDYFKNNKL